MKLVKIGFINGLGRTRGCEKAPNAIAKVLKDIWSKEQDTAKEFDIEEIKVDNSNIEKSVKKIIKESAEHFSEKEKAIFVGGDHSVSFALANSFKFIYRNSGLVVLDAHADCMKPMKEPTHEEWLRGAIEKGFDAKNVIVVGLRNVYPDESEFLKKNKINCYWMNELFSEFEKSCDLITEHARKFENLYVSIDIDAVDPAFAPGTGYTEPGGLTSRQFLHLINRLSLLKNVRAVDIVEVNPEKDLNSMTVLLAAKTITELS